MNYHKKGAWNAICPVCEFEKKSTDFKRRWDGQMVCSECWEPRHQQEQVRGKPDDVSIPWSHPEPSSDTEQDTSGWAGESGSYPAGTFDSNNGTL